MLLAVVLSDKMFLSHTRDTYSGPWRSKISALEVLQAVLALDKLEFLVGLSSAAAFGSPGQANYARYETPDNISLAFCSLYRLSVRTRLWRRL